MRHVLLCAAHLGCGEVAVRYVYDRLMTQVPGCAEHGKDLDMHFSRDTIEHDFRELVAALHRERQSPPPRGWWARKLLPYAVREIGPLRSEVLAGRYVTRWGARRAKRQLEAELPELSAAGYTWKVVTVK